MSVLLRFNDVKFLNFSISRRLLGRLFTDVVIAGVASAELEANEAVVYDERDADSQGENNSTCSAATHFPSECV